MSTLVAAILLALLLLASHHIAGNLSGAPMVCGQWRDQVTIDAQAPKPRSLAVRHHVLVPANCALDEYRAR